MDNLMNFGKQAYQAYEGSQQGNVGGNNSYGGGGNQGNPYNQQGSNNDNNDYGQQQGNYGQSGFTNQQGHNGQPGGQFGVQGSAALNSNDNRRPGGQFGFDPSYAQQHAEQAGGADGGMFGNVLGMLGQQDHSPDDVDENHVMDAHQQAYQQGNAGNMSANSMGAAAAMQALSKFTNGGGGMQQQGGGGGGNMQSALIGQALSEAGRLFDQNGGAASGSKQDAMQSAGATMIKLLMKGQGSGLMGGSGGGLSGMLSMASKFM